MHFKNVLFLLTQTLTIEGFDDIRYGVLAAQKQWLQRKLSSFGLAEFENYLST